MSPIKLQQGASTAGLLTASAIFVGLVVYANQFGFEDSPFSDQILSEQAESVPEVAPVASKDAVIQPQSGIFSTPTLTDVKADLPLQSGESKPVATAESESVETEELAETASQTPAISDAGAYSVPATAYANLAQTMPVAAGYPQDYAAANFDLMQQQQFDAYQRMAHDGRGYGRGKGRGNADGEGEFDFSMSFKSRARMAADSDMETDFDAATNQYYLGDFYADNGFYPSYGYSQYRY